MLDATVELPLSKSVANRALAIAALTPDAPRPDALPDCDDVNVMAATLGAPGGSVADCHGAGTALRFLTAVIAATPGRTLTLTGNDRLRERPIAPLVDALRACGADITYAETDGHAPLLIKGRRLAGGDITMSADTSSQFISALLMAAPAMESGVRLTLDGEIVSEPYVGLTIGMMRRAGAEVEREDNVIAVAPKPYTPAVQPMERDWSAAAFWMEIAAVTSGFVSLPGLDPDSLQPDRSAVKVFENLGVVTSFEDGAAELSASPECSPRLYLDFTMMPDLMPAVTATCALLRIPIHFTGLSTLRIKECDRLEAMRAELERIGVTLTVEGDTVTWNGAYHPVGEMPVFDPHGDHRIAMALAPVAVFLPGIVIRDAEVVDKSYPGFWDDLRAAGFTLADPTEAMSTENAPAQ